MSKRTIDHLSPDLTSDSGPNAQDVAFFEAIAAAAPEAEGVDEVAWARLKRSMAAEKADNRPLWWQRPVASAWQMAACLTAALALGLVVAQTGPGPDTNPAYLPASEERASDTLQVTFVPSATEEEIRTLLRASSLQIIEGPSALGVYRLRFVEGQNLDDVLGKLSASEFVESAAADQ
ncbi:MAG: hypothetical protein AAGH41_03305 [Pseudomonadota bacterium]